MDTAAVATGRDVAQERVLRSHGTLSDIDVATRRAQEAGEFSGTCADRAKCGGGREFSDLVFLVGWVIWVS
jgi:hypothetical protein